MNATEILSHLVAMPTDSTTAAHYTECAEFIARELEACGFEVQIIDGGTGKLPKPNVLGTKKGSKDGYVLFAAHFDVVPVGDGWASDPWTPTLSDEKLYGRGSSDDKGAIAAFLEAMHDLDPTIGVKALFTCDEEIGGTEGLGYVTENCKKFFEDVKLAWIADSAITFVGIGSSGVLGGKITVHGIGGHAGYPFAADNAVERLFDLMTFLRNYREIREKKISIASAPDQAPRSNVWGRFSITMLNAGVKTNVIPDRAEACFDIRFLPEETRAEVEAEFSEFFAQCVANANVRADLTFIYGHEGYLQEITPVIEEFRGLVASAFGSVGFAAELGGNDGPFIFHLGIPTISFGVISHDSRFHMNNEFIRITDLNKMVQAIRNVYSSDIKI